MRNKVGNDDHWEVDNDLNIFSLDRPNIKIETEIETDAETEAERRFGSTWLVCKANGVLFIVTSFQMTFNTNIQTKWWWVNTFAANANANANQRRYIARWYFSIILRKETSINFGFLCFFWGRRRRRRGLDDGKIPISSEKYQNQMRLSMPRSSLTIYQCFKSRITFWYAHLKCNRSKMNSPDEFSNIFDTE